MNVCLHHRSRNSDKVSPVPKGDVLHLSGHSIAWPLASWLTSALSCQQASHAHALAEALFVLRPFQAGGINEPVDILARPRRRIPAPVPPDRLYKPACAAPGLVLPPQMTEGRKDYRSPPLYNVPDGQGGTPPQPIPPHLGDDQGLPTSADGAMLNPHLQAILWSQTGEVRLTSAGMGGTAR
jgi:hypothetical protein